MQIFDALQPNENGICWIRYIERYLVTINSFLELEYAYTC